MQPATFSACIYLDGFVWLFSNNQCKSFRYDVNNDSFHELEIDNICCNAFIGAVVFDGDIYVMPYRYDKVVKIEIENKLIKYLSDWKEIFGATKNDYVNGFSLNSKQEVVMAIPGNNRFLVFSLKAEKMSVMESLDADADYIDVCFCDDSLVAFNRKNERLELLDSSGNIIKSKAMGTSLSKLTSIGGRFIFDYIDSDTIIICSENLNFEKEYSINYEESSMRMGYHCFFGWTTDADGNYYGINNELVIIDDCLQLKTKELKMDNCLFDDFSKAVLKNCKEPLVENKMLGLEQLISSF
jgi:hypothetical protein